MKKVTFVMLLLLASLMLQAQDDSVKPSITNDTIRPPRLKVGVVLGGGGAKGASHIGVLKYIEEMGIPVDYVAGTSMGSIIGGFYALGYSPEELTRLIAGMDWSQYIGNRIDRSMMSEEVRYRNSTMTLLVPFSHESLLDGNANASFLSQLPSAYVNNSSLVNLFNDLCVGYQEDMDFNDLPIPFACVATDMITGKEVVLRSGSISSAMRASMAIPGVFSPVTMDDKVLVDGGLVNNFPADVLKEMGADIIIGVEVTSNKVVTTDDLRSLPQVFARLLITSTSAKRIENRSLCDVHIVPDISGFGMLSFTSEAIDTLVGRGYRKAASYHDQLLAIKKAVDASAGEPISKTLRAPHAQNLASDSVLLRSITINNVSDKESRWLIRKGGLKVGNRYNKDDIDQAMKIYRGTGCYDEITYRVKECDSIHLNDRLSEAYDLNIDMKPAQPHIFGMGVRYDTEEGASILLNVGLNEKKFNGSKLNFSAKLSYNPRINLTYTYSRSSLAKFNLDFGYRDEHFRVLTDVQKGMNLHYREKKMSFYISQFHLLNFNTTLGLSYNSTIFDRSSFDIDNILDSLVFVNNRQITPFVNVKYDNLDDAYFAKHGILANTSVRYHMEPKTPNRCFDLSLAVQGYITPLNGRVTIIPQLYGRYLSGATGYFNLWNMFGGEIAGRHFEQQFPFIGLTSMQYTLDKTSVMRCDVRYNFFGRHYLTAMYNLLAVYDEYNTYQQFYFDSQGAGLKYSYNSPLGPISLAGYWVNLEGYSMFGAYFSFGYTF